MPIKLEDCIHYEVTKSGGQQQIFKMSNGQTVALANGKLCVLSQGMYCTRGTGQKVTFSPGSSCRKIGNVSTCLPPTSLLQPPIYVISCVDLETIYSFFYSLWPLFILMVSAVYLPYE